MAFPGSLGCPGDRQSSASQEVQLFLEPAVEKFRQMFDLRMIPLTCIVGLGAFSLVSYNRRNWRDLTLTYPSQVAWKEPIPAWETGSCRRPNRVLRRRLDGLRAPDHDKTVNLAKLGNFFPRLLATIHRFVNRWPPRCLRCLTERRALASIGFRIGSRRPTPNKGSPRLLATR